MDDENTKVKEEDRHMNKMKKLATLLLAVCLVVPCFSMLTHAANGKIMFTDPTTAVGETMELKGVLEASAAIEDRTIVMTYDTNMLKFTSGDNVTENEAGKLTYEVKGQKSGTRVEFLMYFDVLQEGSTTVGVESYQAYTTSNAAITCTKGSSTITINPGEAPVDTTDAPTATGSAIVDINGESYTFADEFPSTDIPEGFMASTMEYAGAQHRVVIQESTGITLGYMVNGSGEGKFFMYAEENATFVPFEQIHISETTVITILSSVENITLPEPYVSTTVTINSVEFPAWQNTENAELCILYALNSVGEKTFYQFDTAEGTYQRFELPTVEEEEEKEDNSLIGKLSTVLGEHLDYVIMGVGLGLIFFVILILVLSVKLYNRNAELDELYDEYGIDLEEEEEKEGIVVIGDDDEEDDNDDDEDDNDDGYFVVDINVDDDAEEEEMPEEEEAEKDLEHDVVFDSPTLGDISEQEGKDDLEFDSWFDEETKEVVKTVEQGLLDDEDEDDFFDDDKGLDFEIDFIDLDD